MAKENDFYQVSLKAILKNDKGEILALEGAKGGSYEGFYDLPGGRIDKNEFTVPLIEILKREIREEIGDVEFIIEDKPVAVGRHLLKPHISYESQDTPVLYLFYEAKYEGGDVNFSEEHDGFKWLGLENVELKKYFTSGILEGMRMYLKK